MRNTQWQGGRIVAAAGLCLSLLAGPLIQTASAQNIGGPILKVLGGGDNRQGEKNAMRNLGIGLGAVAGYEALNHRGTSALLFGAGAALAASKYENVRKAQSRDNDRFSYDRDWRRDHDRDNNRRDDRHDDRWQRDANQKRFGRFDHDDRHDARRNHNRDHDNHDQDWRRNHDHDRF